MQAPGTAIAPFGLLTLILGALALLTAAVVIYAGPFGPQQEIGVSIGEIAGDIAKSAWREMRNLPHPEATAAPLSIDDYLQMAVAALGVLALVAGILAIVRHEPWRPVAGGLTLAGLALALQFVFWVVAVIVGVVLLVAIISNLGEILSAFGG